MRPHHNLDVWRKAVDFVVDIYKMTEKFPKEEKFGLTEKRLDDIGRMLTGLSNHLKRNRT